MPTLLHLDSSADPARSVSREITAAFAAAWRALGPDHRVVHRDLHADPPAHLATGALHWPAELRPAGATIPPEAETMQRELLDELLASDALLIGAPMYNYSMPSTLKAWVDHIHVPGVTASLDENAPPLSGHRAVVVTSRGAVYDPGTAYEHADHVVPPLQLVLGDALGMRLDTIVVTRTLAGFLPVLDGELDRARQERQDALARAERLAAEIGG